MGSRIDPLAEPAPLIRSVYAYAVYRVGDLVAADDVTGEVFERAVRYRKSFDPARGTPTSWLVGIARRVIAERLGRPPVDLGLELDESPDKVDVEASTIRRLDLHAAISRLSDRDRELIGLRYGADLTASQIARVVDSDTHRVEVALSRALSRLRLLTEELQRM
jgi:RNA polymerase sigma-70 factor (ECF subfamily)